MANLLDEASILLSATAYNNGSMLAVKPENGDGDFTFSRNSAATRVNAQGLVENVASNLPRINYEGFSYDANGDIIPNSGCGSLLLEPQSTNLITQSELFSDSYWTKSGTSVVSGFASPDGGLNAFKLVEATNIGQHFIYKQLNTTTLSTYTASIFAKVGENDFIILQDPFSSGNPRQWFDLNNGILGTGTNISNASIIPFGNGFYKCTATWVVSSVNGGIGINTSKLDNSNSYTGDGTSGVYIYGAMLEQNSFSTSYIPTTQGAISTRLADIATNSGNASLINSEEGVLYAEISALVDPVVFNNWLTITDGTSSNSVGIVFETTGTATARIEVGGVGQAYLNTSVDYSNLIKVAFKYKENDFAWWVNGIEVGTDSSGITFPLNTLNSLQFSYGAGSNNWLGKNKALAVYKTALTDLELESITSWASFTEMAKTLNYTIK